jgi:ParB-like chromosome segregation protein Spo0J
MVLTAVSPASAPTDDRLEVVDVATSSLRMGRSPRDRGIDHAHVALLAEAHEHWPPIVVSRRDRAVIDGQHRVAAAKQLGLKRLRAVYFDGTPDDAYVEFVRRNVGHGLALTLEERRAAVRRILLTHPDRSDRSIATVCGLSPKTVARVRREADGATGGKGAARTKKRVGRDGRKRPVDSRASRARIVEELERRPDASLRSIASTVGVSPETVRSMREKLRSGREHPDDAVAPAEPAAAVLAMLSGKRRRGVPLGRDRAFTDCDDGRKFVDWFEATCIDDADLWQHAGAVPRSRVYEIADEARRRAALWSRFAEQLEGQVCKRA